MKIPFRTLALLSALTAGASAQTTAFTYQGRLTENGGPATGTYDFQLTLFDSLTAGTQTGTTGTFEDVSVSNGVFTVTFDPGASVFTGAPRWLSLAVRSGAATGAYTPLTPRQPVTSAPYAVRAGSAATATTAASATNYTGPVADSQLSPNISRLNAGNQTFTGPVNFTNAGNTFSGVFSGSGAGLSQVPLTGLVKQNPSTPIAWGLNVSGGTIVPPNLTGVVRIAAGRYRSVALKADGSVVEWGDTGWGLAPAGLTGLTAVSAGFFHCVGLRQNGTVTGWGSNSNGQLDAPAGLAGVTAVAAGALFSLALKQDGTVVAWGSNSQGQATIPAGLTGVLAISAGYTHSLALRQNGTVVAWGSNLDGESTVPPGLTGVTALSASNGRSLALKQDGTVVTWGYNGGANVPAELDGVVAIAAGESFSLALRQDGTLATWGDGTFGQLLPPVSAGIAAIAAGSGHGLALPVPQTAAVPALLDRSNVFPGSQFFTGRVGIDTLSPSALLSLGSGVAFTKLALWDGGPVNGSYGLGIGPGQFRLHVDSPSSRFSFLNAPGGQELMTIRGNGRVGIGTDNPQAKLEVVGGVSIGSGGTVINKMQTGNAFVGPGSGVKTVTVTFPAPFATPPRVLLTPRGEDYVDVFAASTRSVTTTGFTMNVLRLDAPGVPWGQNLTVDWIATD